MEAVWFYSSNGEDRTGPVAERALRELFEAGTIRPSTLVWRDGMADWAQLDAATGWAAAPAAAVADPLSADWSEAAHPWRRYFSRSADYLLVGMPLIFIAIVPLAAILGGDSPLMKILSNPFVCQILTVCLFPFGEALLLSTWGYTPTRALMGMRIRNAAGGKLSYRQALGRSWRVALQGMGLGIPLVVLITNVAAYNYLRDSKATTWDESLNVSVQHRRWGVLRGTAVVLWCVVVLTVAAVLNSRAFK